MTVKVNIAGSEAPEDNNIKVKISDPDLRVEIVDENSPISFKLNARKTLNGDIMIFDHTDIDIIVLTEKKKVVAFAKNIMSDIVYGAETRLFEFLRTKGVVAYDSIQGGNVYGSLEGVILESKELDSTKIVLLNILNQKKKQKNYYLFWNRKER